MPDKPRLRPEPDHNAAPPVKAGADPSRVRTVYTGGEPTGYVYTPKPPVTVKTPNVYTPDHSSVHNAYTEETLFFREPLWPSRETLKALSDETLMRVHNVYRAEVVRRQRAKAKER